MVVQDLAEIDDEVVVMVQGIEEPLYLYIIADDREMRIPKQMRQNFGSRRCIM